MKASKITIDELKLKGSYLYTAQKKIDQPNRN